MPNYITEDDIEQAILDKLRAEPFNYDIIICDADTSKRDDINDGIGWNRIFTIWSQKVTQCIKRA